MDGRRMYFGTLYNKFSKPLAIDQSHVIILISVPGLSHCYTPDTGYDITDPFHPKYRLGWAEFWQI